MAPELAERVIARALARGGDFGELYAEDRRGFTVTLDDGRVEGTRAGAERGASVRVVRGEASYFGHVDGIDEASLLEVADDGETVTAESLEAAVTSTGSLTVEPEIIVDECFTGPPCPERESPGPPAARATPSFTG